MTSLPQRCAFLRPARQVNVPYPDLPDGTADINVVESDQFAEKQGMCGIVDTKFMVEYAVPAWPPGYPSFFRWTDIIRILETLEAEGLFTEIGRAHV